MKRRLLSMRPVCWSGSYLVVAIAAGALFLVTASADAALRHRYSFGEGATADASNRTIVDSKGGANGTVLGAGATALAGELVLPGGASATQAYVNLPNGMISQLTDVTFEAWYTPTSAQNWSHLFDFGSTTGGELAGPGGGGEGLDYIFFGPFRGAPGNIDQQRAGMRNNDPATLGGVPGTVAGAESIIDPELDTDLNITHHVVLSYDADGGGAPGMATMNLFIDGVNPPGHTFPQAATIQLSNLNDVNNWLGRSNWTGDGNFGGRFDEFRIYDNTFNASMAAQSFANGPNGAIVPEPASLALFVAAIAGGLFAVRRKLCR